MFVTPSTLQTVVLKNIAPSFFRDYFFKNSALYPNGEVVIEVIKGGKAVAPFVAPIIGGKVVEREGSRLGVYAPPNIAPQRIVSQDDVLKAAGNSAVTIIDDGSTPESRQAKLIKQDFLDFEDMITRREELMCIEAVIDGKVTVEGDGYKKSEINFWVDPADKPYKELSGAALWTATTADPLADIEFGISKTQERGGIAATDVIMRPEDWALARNNEKLLKALDTSNLDVGEIFGQTTPNELGVRLVGRLAGARIWTYSKTVQDQSANGELTSKNVMPLGKIVFGSQQVQTEMAYGVVSIKNTKQHKMDYLAVKRAPNQRLTDAGILNEMKSAPLPLPKNPDGFYTIKVRA